MRILLAAICVTFATAQLGRAAEDVVVDAQTASVLKGALKWLAAQQGANGSWVTGDKGAKAYPVAMTGYTLMAFMANGQLPEEGEYSKNVAAGMQFLLDSVQADGTFRGVDGSK